MSSSVSIRFTQSCPTCGRRVQIRASYLGSTVACQHCQGEFVATACDDRQDHIDESSRLMARVERALGDVV